MLMRLCGLPSLPDEDPRVKTSYAFLMKTAGHEQASFADDWQ